MNALSRLVSFLCLGCYSVFAQAVSEISISAAHVEHAMGDAKNIALKVSLNQPKPTVTLHAALKPAKADAQSKPEDWVQFDLTCDLPKSLNTVEARCINGRLKR